LTQEDQKRRHEEAVAAKLEEHAKLMEITERACQEIARAAREMNSVEEELRGLGENGRASALRNSRPAYVWTVLQVLAEQETAARARAEQERVALERERAGLPPIDRKRKSPTSPAEA
jgi:hypothetical protein